MLSVKYGFFLVCLEKEIAKFPKMCYTATCTSNERTKDNIMTVQHKQAFWKGVRQGIPIALGVSLCFVQHWDFGGKSRAFRFRSRCDFHDECHLSRTGCRNWSHCSRRLLLRTCSHAVLHQLAICLDGAFPVAEIRPDVSAHDTSLSDCIRDY